MIINVRHVENISRRLNLHILRIPRRETRTNGNETVFRKITEKKVFLMQTCSSTQSTRVHMFIGQVTKNSNKNRNLQNLMEFLKISDLKKKAF